ncbi:hypothetical protein UXO16_20115 [Enterobacter hormaechei]|uniref:Uncharacterized protein n=1 Tax=Enterobacter ludwigii TaxID=299767 RepID=A0AAX3LIU2_9ENTR|nr:MULTISPECIES: hypothetical protein [Enterobacter cloacae complex]MCW4755575.1 hypothetical protein [Enterobacter hormaechei]WCE15933.1 hypothetical protein PHA72_26685 [Enterobacter ludwigii]
MKAETSIAELALLRSSGGTRTVEAGDFSAASNASFAATMFLTAFNSFFSAEVAVAFIPVSDAIVAKSS